MPSFSTYVCGRPLVNDLKKAGFFLQRTDSVIIASGMNQESVDWIAAKAWLSFPSDSDADLIRIAMPFPRVSF